jgi:hypothetical protein
MQKLLPDQSALQELLSYNPLTGVLIWHTRGEQLFQSPARCRSWNQRYAGKPALNHIGSQGYRTGSILGTTYQSHRVIWKLLIGTDPTFVDHINGDRSDNRWVNLRNVSFIQNLQNQRLASNNTSKVLGVYHLPHTGKWIARICVNRKQHNLGTYANKKDAIQARKAAERLHNFHTNHGSTS